MDRVTGGSLAAPAWRRFMTDALEGVPHSNLPGTIVPGKIAR
jgi:membrane carboxypeptidase/penicillin-binding protein